MFSGIIITIGTIEKVERKGNTFRVTCALSNKTHRAVLHRGMSVSMDGICLTATEITQSGFVVDVTEETARVTTIEEWKKGRKINIEFPTTPDAMLSGHLVLGHVDAVGTIVDAYTQGNGKRLVFSLSADLLRFLPYKGSVTLNGVSLTIANVDAEHEQCIVALVPHTLKHTNLGDLQKGSRVNIEVDVIARYLDHLLAERLRTFEQKLLAMHTHEDK